MSSKVLAVMVFHRKYGMLCCHSRTKATLHTVPLSPLSEFCVFIFRHMKLIFRIILACFLAGAYTPLQAQRDTMPPLASLLPTLDAAQQAKVLDYAHFLGAYYGKGLEATCKLLDAKNQERVARYIAVLKNPGKPIPTTVRWDRDTLPFGQVEEGFIMLDSFTVINTGSAPYIIHNAKSNCDCTVLHYPDFPVMPGDSATIRIEFDSGGKVGPARPGIILYDNSRPNRRNILYLDGFVLPRKAVKIIKN